MIKRTDQHIEEMLCAEEFGGFLLDEAHVLHDGVVPEAAAVAQHVGDARVVAAQAVEQRADSLDQHLQLLVHFGQFLLCCVSLLFSFVAFVLRKEENFKSFSLLSILNPDL